MGPGGVVRNLPRIPMIRVELNPETEAQQKGRTAEMDFVNPLSQDFRCHSLSPPYQEDFDDFLSQSCPSSFNNASLFKAALGRYSSSDRLAVPSALPSQNLSTLSPCNSPRQTLSADNTPRGSPLFFQQSLDDVVFDTCQNTSSNFSSPYHTPRNSPPYLLDLSPSPPSNPIDILNTRKYRPVHRGTDSSSFPVVIVTTNLIGLESFQRHSLSLSLSFSLSLYLSLSHSISLSLFVSLSLTLPLSLHLSLSPSLPLSLSPPSLSHSLSLSLSLSHCLSHSLSLSLSLSLTLCLSLSLPLALSLSHSHSLPLSLLLSLSLSPFLSPSLPLSLARSLTLCLSLSPSHSLSLSLSSPLFLYACLSPSSSRCTLPLTLFFSIPSPTLPSFYPSLSSFLSSRSPLPVTPYLHVCLSYSSAPLLLLHSLTISHTHSNKKLNNTARNRPFCPKYCTNLSALPHSPPFTCHPCAYLLNVPNVSASTSTSVLAISALRNASGSPHRFIVLSTCLRAAPVPSPWSLSRVPWHRKRVTSSPQLTISSQHYIPAFIF
ncbi:uncharacterized protein [Hemitrygon akajei]|uniref:uncharacterized protein n=1 Tax=Hemitrygon akajei TaxID=2704970 RepID=UPI003BFA189C